MKRNKFFEEELDVSNTLFTLELLVNPKTQEATLVNNQDLSLCIKILHLIFHVIFFCKQKSPGHKINISCGFYYKDK